MAGKTLNIWNTLNAIIPSQIKWDVSSVSILIRLWLFKKLYC